MQVFINTIGVSLRVKDRVLSIRKPNEPKEKDQHVALSKIKTLCIVRGVTLSTDVLLVAAECDVDVVFVERNGQPVARLWSGKFGSIATIRKQQLLFSQSAATTRWVREQLTEKINAQIALIVSLAKPDTEGIVSSTAEKMRALAERMTQDAPDNMPLNDAGAQLRASEAAAAKMYWRALSACLPPQYRFSTRSQHPAQDMFNGMLNYAYGMLYSKIETALIKAGIDPAIGIFHRDEYNRPVMVYDVIERFRPWADYVVAYLCRQEVVFIEFFDVKGETFRLNDHGKRILIQTLADYFDEVTRYRNNDRSRDTHIELFAYALASMFKEGRWSSEFGTRTIDVGL